MSITRLSNCNILLSRTHILLGLGCQRSTHGWLRPDRGKKKKLLLFHSYDYIMKNLMLQPFYFSLFILTFMAMKKIQIRRDILLILRTLVRIKINHLMYFLNLKISHSKSNHCNCISSNFWICSNQMICSHQEAAKMPFFFFGWCCLFFSSGRAFSWSQSCVASHLIALGMWCSYCPAGNRIRLWFPDFSITNKKNDLHLYPIKLCFSTRGRVRGTVKMVK